MLNFIKGFKRLIPEELQFMILIGLSGLAVVVSLWGQKGFFNFIEVLLPMLLLAGAVIIIQLKKETLIAHSILLFLFFADQFGSIIRAIFSFNFGTSSFTTKITFGMVICAIGTIYL
ncbi:MAG: hypothetical protein CVV58_07590, partial [Tenericutes bacterium HGW-Tenericutes-3]